MCDSVVPVSQELENRNSITHCCDKTADNNLDNKKVDSNLYKAHSDYASSQLIFGRWRALYLTIFNQS